MLKRMDVYGTTDRGQVRDENEDQFLIADLNQSIEVHSTSLSIDRGARMFGGSQAKLLVVADGVGGNAAGRTASQVAVDYLTYQVVNGLSWLGHDEESEGPFLSGLRTAFKQCHLALLRRAAANPAQRGMGTTLTAAWIQWPRVYLVHAGDSRCYLQHQAQLRQLTTDHTVGEMLALAGVPRNEGQRDARLDHLLTNALGANEDDVYPDFSTSQLALGDSLLLCTDGLTKHLSDSRIGEVLGENGSAEETCIKLVEEANACGGRDNITVIVARFSGRATEEISKAAEAAFKDDDHSTEALAESSLSGQFAQPMSHDARMADSDVDTSSHPPWRE